MDEALRYALGALAVYRLTMLCVRDDGPFDVCDRLREWAGCYTYAADGRPATLLGKLLSCTYCLGCWWAVALTALLRYPSGVGDVVLTAAGLAGAQAVIEGAIQGPRE